VERGMQTFNNVLKTKDVQASLLKQVNAECMVNAWSIHDAYAYDNSSARADMTYVLTALTLFSFLIY
jgi:hypothetical protein